LSEQLRRELETVHGFHILCVALGAPRGMHRANAFVRGYHRRTMSVVAITGISGYLGRRLFGVLDADPSIERIVGIDVEEPANVSSKLDFHRVDVRDADLAKALPGVDVLVHLAYATDPLRDEALMRDINVAGTHTVLDAVRTMAVPRLVYVSSGVVYGAHPDNDFPLTERSPLRANADFSYAAHKLETEALVAAFAASNPSVAVTVFRPAIVFGPGVENFVSRAFEAPRVVTVKGYAPPMQLVHEEDVARALALAVRTPLPGVFNVCADGWLEPHEVREIVGANRWMQLPEPIAFSLAERLWRAGISESPPGELKFWMYPWVMSNERLKAAGWSPEHSNFATLHEALATRRQYVTFGRARVRKGDLARGAAATLGAVGAMAVVRRSRRRRAHIV
jgi:nucleoside-diphosphate-sugar epimerase